MVYTLSGLAPCRTFVLERPFALLALWGIILADWHCRGKSIQQPKHLQEEITEFAGVEYWARVRSFNLGARFHYDADVDAEDELGRSQ